MWRPENWDSLDIYAEVESIATRGTDFIEAGADAMLEALKQQGGVRLTNTLETIDQYVIKIKDLPDGIWKVILIPEEG